MTVTGVVRRAHPAATDRRYAVVPRGPADLALGATGGASGASTGAGSGEAGGPAGRVLPFTGPTDVDLADLEAHLGRTVRVGGLVVDLAANGFTLDDGTAVGTIILLDAAAEFLPLLEPGDALNATGRIERRDERVVVAVRDPAGLARVGDLADPIPSTSDGPARPTPLSGRPLTATAQPFGLDTPTLAGVVSLVLLSTASAAVTVVRRQRVRRRLLARVTARLGAVGGQQGGGRGPSGRP